MFAHYIHYFKLIPLFVDEKILYTVVGIKFYKTSIIFISINKKKLKILIFNINKLFIDILC